VYSVAFHPDGTILASGGNDNTIRLWDLARGVERIELRGHGNYVHGLSFSVDGATLASASGDNTVRLWSTLTMRERKWRADAALAARAAVAPKVEALFATLGDARAVANAVRADAVLDDAQRRAALHLILMRSGGKQ
jgi:WD40 repeat protein